MTTLRSLFGLPLTLGILILVSGCTSESGFAPGQSPPNFVVRGVNGEAISLDQYKGKTVLLNFWASWCEPCRVELPQLRKLAASLDPKNFIVLTIAVEDQKEAALEQLGAHSGNLIPAFDLDGSVRAQFKLQGFPESFLVDREGKLILFPDPESGRADVRIVGPREWSSPKMMARIRAATGMTASVH